jgi:transmembrane protein EpsG
MGIYLINMSIVTLSTFFGSLHKRYDKKAGWFLSKVYTAIATLSLAFISGFRYKVGTDYQTYVEIYYLVRSQNKIKLSLEPLFILLIKLLANITSNPQILFFVTALITNVLIVRSLKKYSVNMTLSMYFYITTFSYYATMNGLRQYMASAILFYGFKHVLEGNFKQYLFYIVVAMFIHQSAFIMILIYFLARNKVDSKNNLLVVIIFICSILVYQPFVNFLSAFTKFTRFDNYIEIFATDNNGVNILRILVAALPGLFMFLYRDKVRKELGNKADIIINMCLFSTLFMTLAWRQVFFARMCMYFDFYYLLALPIICRLFDKKTNKFLTLLLMLCYFTYSTFLLLSGDSWIYPYKYNIKLF